MSGKRQRFASAGAHIPGLEDRLGKHRLEPALVVRADPDVVHLALRPDGPAKPHRPTCI
jgi:hypothetical protein